MATIHIPENGILLRDAPCSEPDNDHDAGAQPQVMRLDLADGVLEGIMKASRMGKDIHMSFGKNVVSLGSCCLPIVQMKGKPIVNDPIANG